MVLSLETLNKIENRKKKVVNVILEWQKQNFPLRTDNYEKCQRDLDIVIQAYLDDMKSNATRSITYVAGKYWFAGERQIKDLDTELSIHKYAKEAFITEFCQDEDRREEFCNLYKIFINILTNGPKYQTHTYMHRYRYVMEYDTEAFVDPMIINQALHEAWNTTPSKQNMMPYSVFVIGPGSSKIRDLIYYKAVQREYITNSPRYDVDENDPIAIEKEFLKQRPIPQYYNFKTAPYILIFTQRVEDKMNIWNQHLSDTQGMNFEQASKDRMHRAAKLSSIEIGMFAQTFSNSCLKHGVDISHTRCLPTELEWWSEPEFSFLENPPVMVMSAGIGKQYRRGFYSFLDHSIDYRPDFERIVKFV